MRAGKRPARPCSDLFTSTVWSTSHSVAIHREIMRKCLNLLLVSYPIPNVLRAPVAKNQPSNLHFQRQLQVVIESFNGHYYNTA
jgi:hypothetical protein